MISNDSDLTLQKALDLGRMNELSQLQVKQMKGPAAYGVGSRPKTRRKLRVTANRPPVKHEEPVHNCKTVHKQVLCQKCGNNHSKHTTDLAKGNQWVIVRIRKQILH